MYYLNEPVSCEQFLNYLDQLPWCKQGDSTLITVHQCTPAVIEVIKHRDVKVFPGHMIIKMNKSVLRRLENKFREQEPIPMLLVWKADGVEISFRTHKSEDFPYDIWESPAGEAYEREAVFIAAEELGEQVTKCFNNHMKGAHGCPITVPRL